LGSRFRYFDCTLLPVRKYEQYCSQPRLDAPNQCSEPVTSLGQLQRNESKIAAAIAFAHKAATARA
jgi:hypothetical protein